MHRLHQFPRPGVDGRAGDAPGVGLYQEHQDILPRHRRDLPPLARQGVRVVLRKFLPGEKDFSSLSAVEVQTEELPRFGWGQGPVQEEEVAGGKRIGIVLEKEVRSDGPGSEVGTAPAAAIGSGELFTSRSRK